MKEKNYWNPQTIINEFKKYTTPNEARVNSYGAWKAMKRLLATNPKLEEQALSHMKRKNSWKKNDVLKELKEFSSMKELRENNSALYHYVWRLNQTSPKYVQSITEHFSDPLPKSLIVNYLEKYTLKEVSNLEYQINYSISTSISVRMDSNISINEFKNLLLPKLQVQGELPYIGCYIIFCDFNEKDIKENSLGKHLLLKVKLTLYKKDQLLEKILMLKNLVIDSYYEWLELQIPLALSDLTPVSQSENIKNQFVTKRRHPTKGNHRLSEDQIKQVRTWRVAGLEYKQILNLCAEANIPLSSKGHLSNIINQKTWRIHENKNI